MSETQTAPTEETKQTPRWRRPAVLIPVGIVAAVVAGVLLYLFQPWKLFVDEVVNEDFPVAKYDKVLFHPKNAIPVDLEPNNVLFVVPIDDVVAVFRRNRNPKLGEEGDADVTDISDFEDSDEI